MRKFISIIAALLVWIPGAAQELHPLTPHPEGVEWPTNGWTYGEMPAETAPLVRALINSAMAGEKPDEMGETRSIVIVHGGRIVAEVFREGFTKDTKQISWSVAKSITNGLVGSSVESGVIKSIDDPMPSPYPPGDPRRDISWRHWLNMTEGLSNHELSPVPLHENLFIDMMFGSGKTDIAAFAVEHIVPETTPGDVWKYSTAGYHMIGWALQNDLRNGLELEVFDDRRLDNFKTQYLSMIQSGVDRGTINANELEGWETAFTQAAAFAPEQRGQFLVNIGSAFKFQNSLFSKVGMTSATPEFDAAGTYLGGSNVWASAHDYAKFGYLYLRDGVWEGERILPEGWVDFSRTRTSGDNINTYGAGFWVTTYGEEPMREQALQSPPWDTFNANGSEGQMISIVPSRDLVIVRTGQMANNTENWNALFDWSQEIARAFPEVDLTPTSSPLETAAAE